MKSLLILLKSNNFGITYNGNYYPIGTIFRSRKQDASWRLDMVTGEIIHYTNISIDKSFTLPKNAFIKYFLIGTKNIEVSSNAINSSIPSTG